MLELFSPKADVGVFRQYPDLYEIVTGLKGSFQITWANERVSHGSKVVCLIIRPAEDLKDTFGFDREISFFLFPYDNIQARAFQAIDQFCHESPLHERVDPSVIFMNAPDANLLEKIRTQQSEYPQSRIVVGLTDQVLKSARRDHWAVNNAIKHSLFIRNLFNYKLPLQPRQYFYGREQTVAALADNIRKSQNGGLFGLRKTGKTSTLLRVSKFIKEEGGSPPIFIDCKKRYIRSLTCDGLIERIVKEIDHQFSTKAHKLFENSNRLDATEILEKAIVAIPRGKKVCLIFDEIEYISPISPTDQHWKRDFVDFWQAIWAIQSETQKISFIICGVNPSVCEISRFEINENVTVQNPMFGIVDIQYLRGFEREALSRMIAFFGKRMGLRFSDGAIDYVWERFGGHPLLSRLACSFYHEAFLSTGADRPVDITVEIERSMEAACETEIASYCEHIVSEVREFYPDEFELLSLIARNEIDAFRILASNPASISHISNYGLVDGDMRKRPIILIPALERYLRDRYMRENGVPFFRDIVDEQHRSEWLERRKRSIDDDFSLLNDELRESGDFDLFAGGALKKIGDFHRCPVASEQAGLTSFLMTTHSVLVENIERHLKGLGKGFYEDFALEFPLLFRALKRLKVYRHSFGHLDLRPQWRAQYQLFVEEDFGVNGGKIIAETPFVMQQVVLDEIHVALQYELARY